MLQSEARLIRKKSLRLENLDEQSSPKAWNLFLLAKGISYKNVQLISQFVSPYTGELPILDVHSINLIVNDGLVVLGLRNNCTLDLNSLLKIFEHQTLIQSYS
jgi:hypothetical protein